MGTTATNTDTLCVKTSISPVVACLQVWHNGAPSQHKASPSYHYSQQAPFSQLASALEFFLLLTSTNPLQEARIVAFHAIDCMIHSHSSMALPLVVGTVSPLRRFYPCLRFWLNSYRCDVPSQLLLTIQKYGIIDSS